MNTLKKKNVFKFFLQRLCVIPFLQGFFCMWHRPGTKVFLCVEMDFVFFFSLGTLDGTPELNVLKGQNLLHSNQKRL